MRHLARFERASRYNRQFQPAARTRVGRHGHCADARGIFIRYESSNNVNLSHFMLFVNKIALHADVYVAQPMPWSAGAADLFLENIETKTKAIDSKMKVYNNDRIIFMLLQSNEQGAVESIRDQMTP